MARQTSEYNALLNAIQNDFHHSPGEWLRWLCDDVLADLGKRKTEIPPESAQEKLFDLARLYGRCMRDLPPFSDILGSLYMDIASKRGRDMLGQFFTPENVCNAMAEMMLHNTPTPTGRLLSVCDPTCGSGAMLLSAARTLYRMHGKDVLLNWSFTGVDLDGICARMCAVQLLGNAHMHEAPLGEVAVYRADSLRLGLMPGYEPEVIIHATAATSRPDAAVVIPATHPSRLEAIREAAQTTMPMDQIGLFDDPEAA